MCIPNDIPNVLACLTRLEEMVISLILPCCTVFDL